MKAYRIVSDLVWKLSYLDTYMYTNRTNIVGIKIRKFSFDYLFAPIWRDNFCCSFRVFFSYVVHLRKVFHTVHNYWFDDSGCKLENMGGGVAMLDMITCCPLPQKGLDWCFWTMVDCRSLNLNTKGIVVVHIGFLFFLFFQDFTRGRKSTFEKC